MVIWNTSRWRAGSSTAGRGRWYVRQTSTAHPCWQPVSPREEAAGWNSGYVPTLFHINPSSTGEKTGDVIDGAMVLYNDSISENTISSTYFTAERLEEECLAYLKESKTVPEEDKILLGKKVGEQGERKGSVYRHEELSKYHNAIAKAFLDSYLGNAK